MKKSILAFMYAAVTSLIISSCSANYFNEERYEDLIKDVFPVSGFDTNHSWNLMQTVNAIVDLNAQKWYRYPTEERVYPEN